MLKYKNYIFTVSAGCRDRFDLHKEVLNKKTEKLRKELVGYGYRFEDAIEKIIRTEAGANKNVTTLQKYVLEYKRLLLETQSLISECNVRK